MKVVLVFLPCADPALPYGSLPLLAAILKRAGYTDVTIRDLNVEAFDDLLVVEQLRNATDRIHRQLRESSRRGGGRQLDLDYQTQLAYALQGSDEVISNIDHALQVLRDPVEFYKPFSLLFAKRIFHMACALLSAPYPSVHFGKYSYSSHSYDSFEQIETAIDADERGLLGEYLRTVALPSILESKPQVVGFAIPYFSQLIPTFFLARLLKAQDPSLHIMLGGPVPTWGKHVFAKDARFGRWIDSVAIGEADQTLLELLEALEGRRERQAVRNFLQYCDGSVVERFDSTYQVDMNWLPTPDFTLMPMDRYFAPKRVICMAPTRGCYYNRCAFCNYAFIKIAPYRIRKAHLVAQDVQRIVEQTGEDVFCFESDVMLPHYLKQLSQAFIESGVNIRWHAVARFEKGMPRGLFELMHKAGCTRLYMGMESANQRILDLMDKGTSKERMVQILENCYESNIAIEAGVFGNFPTETPEEAEETYQFVEENREKITRCDVGEFRLLRGTPVSEHPERFGIKILGDVESKWYHLEFEGPTPRSYQVHVATPMQKIQQLYPEVAFVDVSEDILYTAKHGPNTFAHFFRRIQLKAKGEIDMQACPVLSDEILVMQAYVGNSGGILFLDPSFRLHEVMPAFTSSEIPLLFALNRSSHAFYPLSWIDLLVIQLCDGEKTIAEICEEILIQTREGKDVHLGSLEEYQQSFKILIGNNILLRR